MSPLSVACHLGRASIAALLLTCLAPPLAAAITIVATANETTANKAPANKTTANKAPGQSGSPQTITLHLLNQGRSAETVPLPEHLAVSIKNLASTAESTTESSVESQLQRAADTPPSLTVPPMGFATARYLLSGRQPGPEALLAPAAPDGPLAFAPILLQRSLPTTTTLAQTTPPPEAALLPEAAPPSGRHRFLTSFYSYGPVYAVYGPSRTAEGRLQFSLKYRLSGHGEAQNAADSRIFAPAGLYLAYTQRMFWDLGVRSVPFRDINYLPEIFYQSQVTTLNEKAALSGRIGLRHESNGRDGPQSRSLNQIYLSPALSIPLDAHTLLAIAPEFYIPLGHRRGNPDILAYRGQTGLRLSVGAVDGILLATSGRFSFSTGRGALNAELSYPLPGLWKSAPRIYLFLQGFSGYGESMLEYNLHATHLRLGLALVR